MIDNIEIVDIQQNDLNELGLLYEQLSGQKSDYTQMLVNYEKMIRSGMYFLVGARVENKLVGSLMGIQSFDLVGECFPFMIIENVIVSESHRGMGIGRMMFMRIEEIARENNCYYIFFVSGEKRSGAHKFYESLGFATDKVKGYKKFLRGSD